MNYKAQDFYNYFKECYKLDYKEFTIDNILSQKYQYKWFVSSTEELLQEDLPIIPYTHTKTEDLEKEIALYQLEKKLYYACFFVLGKNGNPLIKDNTICAPLLLFPARIKTIDEEKFLSIDRDSLIVNRAVLSRFETKNSSFSIDKFVGEFSDKVIHEQNNYIGLKDFFDAHFSQLDTEELLLFPDVWSVQKIRKHFKTKQYQENEFKIIPAAGTILIEKSESSLRVINDLNEMANQGNFNSATQRLLGDTEVYKEYSFSYYKSRLNTDQYKALQNAYRYSNSVIVGPPGTGKTYTITSIISDAVIKNQSVLVVSKTKQAVEVLRNMLQEDFKLKNYLIHTTGVRYKISLKSKIKKYLSGISSRGYTRLNEKEILQLFEELENLEVQFEKFVEKELRISDLEFSSNLNLLEKWQKFFLKATSFDDTKLWSIFDEIERLLLQLDREISTYSKRKIHANIKANSKIYRRDISLFYDALDSSNFTQYKRILNEVNHSNILKVFPIWLANLSDLNSVLPLVPDLFDLVIMDEATQCDVASALPALYRAKRAVIVGDPNQLRHYSFVSRAQQKALLTQFNLPEEKMFDYRNRSILDLYISQVQDQDQVSFLREHFRSTPSLIEFSNQEFYDGQLEVLKSTPKHTTHQQIELHEVSGERNSKGENEIEAQAVLHKIDELVKQYADESTIPSIGIISPFTAQVNFINKLLRAKYDLAILKTFQVFCGTPYQFQGSEREIILISFAVCDETHHSAFIHASKPEVLNVSITRAKSFQYVFSSFTASELKRESLLAKYISFIKVFSHSNAEDVTIDQFQKEVAHELEQMKYDEIRCSYPIAGSVLDILITHQHQNYFIDLIGYPGMFKDAFPLERYKTLARTGIKSYPLHYRFWQKNKQEALQKLHELIG